MYAVEVEQSLLCLRRPVPLQGKNVAEFPTRQVNRDLPLNPT